ncbi:MAG: extracellular solute-binding protein [Azospirillaceae bacterium]|nr:extracellular solute-binding protein [Azospirillaceae bacterium]
MGIGRFPAAKRGLAILAIIALSRHGAVAAEAIEPRPALAMHGDAKYPPGFDHLDYVNPTAPQGGTLRQAVAGTFDSLNPFIVRGKPAYGLGLIYDTLMTRAWDEPFTLYGLVAATVTVPADRSWVRFTLRPEARFHDGQSITSADVLFTFDLLRDHGRPNHRSYYAKVATASAPDPATVEFHFRRDDDGSLNREMPMIMALMPVLPRHYWQDRSFDQTTLDPPLGSGPYRIGQVDPGRRITYERVRDYWAKGLPIVRGLYNFAEMQFDYYRDDTVALEAFKAGAVDLRRESDPTRWATGYDFPAAHDGRVQRENFAHQRPEPFQGFVFNTRRPIFADRRVRKALALAFDFEWANRTLFHGVYRRTASFFPNSELAATGVPDAAERALLEPWRSQLPPALFDQPFVPPSTGDAGSAGVRANLLKATVLLADAGWTIAQSRLTRDGVPFSFEILLLDSGDEKIALDYSRSLERLGITARVRTVDSAQYQQRLEQFDFDMIVHRWASTLSPGNEQMYYWGSAAADAPGSRNYAGVRSPAIDALAQALAQATTRQDLVTRTRALDRALLWGWYAIPLYYQPDDHLASWTGLHHPATTPLYGALLDDWWREGP